MLTVTLGYVVIPTHDLIWDKRWGKVDVFCFLQSQSFETMNSSNLQISQQKDCPGRPTRNWKCSLRRRKCLTASFSHRRPSEKMVDTSFLFVKDFGWWKHDESNRLGWWVNSPYQLADFLVEFKEKLDVDIHHRSGDDWICHMELAHLYLGQKRPASHRYWKFHSWSFQDFSTRNESRIDSWQETTKYQGVEWAA